VDSSLTGNVDKRKLIKGNLDFASSSFFDLTNFNIKNFEKKIIGMENLQKYFNKNKPESSNEIAEEYKSLRNNPDDVDVQIFLHKIDNPSVNNSQPSPKIKRVRPLKNIKTVDILGKSSTKYKKSMVNIIKKIYEVSIMSSLGIILIYWKLDGTAELFSTHMSTILNFGNFKLNKISIGPNQIIKDWITSKSTQRSLQNHTKMQINFKKLPSGMYDFVNKLDNEPLILSKSRLPSLLKKK